MAIFWQEIDKSFEPEDRLITQMVEHIEDSPFSRPCESIKNWDTIRGVFQDAAAMLWAYKISKMTAQTKIAIDDEVNILLLGKGSNKRR